MDSPVEHILPTNPALSPLIRTFANAFDYRPLCGSAYVARDVSLSAPYLLPPCTACLIEADHLLELGLVKRRKKEWVWKKGVPLGGKVIRVGLYWDWERERARYVRDVFGTVADMRERDESLYSSIAASTKAVARQQRKAKKQAAKSKRLRKCVKR